MTKIWMTHFKLVVLISLLVVGCTPYLVQTDESAGTVISEPDEKIASSSIDMAQWEAFLKSWISDPNNPICDAPGGVLLVETADERFLEAAGVASLEDGRPTETSDPFEIGSNTKSFTVALALQLQENGVLSMDDRLSNWLPELAAQIPNGDQVTLRQLAAIHRASGISPIRSCSH